MDPNTDATTSPVSIHPLLDLAGDPETLKQGSQQWTQASRMIREALDTHGYFLVKYDAVSNGERERLHEVMRSLFNLPLETKRRATYRGGYSFIPIYEAFTVKNAEQRENFEAFTRLMWPDGNAEFCDAINAMSNKLSSLTRVLVNMIFDSYGLGKYQETLTETSTSPLTMNKYLASEREEPVLGIQEHADPGYLTVLGQNEVGGLTVKNRGGDWVEVDPGQSHFVVLVGQSLRALTNGRLHATFHQVSVRGAKDRFSFGSFLSPKPDQTVDVLPEMVNDQCPRQFRPFVYQELAKSVVGGVDVLRTFTGI